jgi:hypothetical protein
MTHSFKVRDKVKLKHDALDRMKLDFAGRHALSRVLIIYAVYGDNIAASVDGTRHSNSVIKPYHCFTRA